MLPRDWEDFKALIQSVIIIAVTIFVLVNWGDIPLD